MNEEIKPWKPEDVVGKLKERIRLEFAQMIPDEQFASMVRKTISEYLQKRDAGWKQVPTLSNFESVVVAELTEATKEEVKKFLNGAEWQGKWVTDGSGRKEASDRIGQLLAEHGSKILNGWLGSSMQMAVEQIIRR